MCGCGRSVRLGVGGGGIGCGVGGVRCGCGDVGIVVMDVVGVGCGFLSFSFSTCGSCGVKKTLSVAAQDFTLEREVCISNAVSTCYSKSVKKII